MHDPTQTREGQAILFVSLQNQVRRDCDEEIRRLEADLAAIERGESPEQDRVEAERTRLFQAIHALKRVRDRSSPHSDLKIGSEVRLARQDWIDKVAQILAEKHGDKEPTDGLRCYAASMAETFYDNPEERMEPKDAVDEELSNC